MRKLGLVLFVFPGLAFAQVRDDSASPAGGWMDRFFGYAAYEASTYQRAINLWLPVAETGDPRAQESIRVPDEEGHGVPQDFGKAVAWYERAADSGDVTALYNLGRIYLEGSLVTQDVDRARDLLRRAADLGDKNAEALLMMPTH